MYVFKTLLITALSGLMPMLAIATGSLDPLETSSYVSHRLNSSVMLTIARAGDELFMAGERGIVMRSSGDGQWSQDQVPVSTSITRIKPVSNGLLALGHSGTVLLLADASQSQWRILINGEDIPDIYQQYIDQAELSDPEKLMLEREVASHTQQGPDKPLFDAIEVAPGRVHVFGAYGLALEMTFSGRTYTSSLLRIDLKRTNTCTFTVRHTMETRSMWWESRVLYTVPTMPASAMSGRKARIQALSSV
ncbi:hypothetical protein EHN06_06660 [Marinobacter sp. NP-4(2019)]|uniref:hypothetical protein n=1 Tax=Marinobacter sp. NP-4(2019) TaxID=2488665 RepID=UPI000FC3EBFB|nr:hypothetical protein [Marinobacter sp. NP-4(2019)]AZT83253.1 hypothetical protein EHN06_06660 [Marinobacter sp. NP-4(2019)]